MIMQINKLVTVKNVPMYKDDHNLYYGVNLYNNTTLTEIDPAVATRYMGDFHGLLHKLQVDPKHWMYVLLLNGYRSSSEYDGVRTLLFLNSNNEYIENMNYVRRINNPKNETFGRI
jgi:hypothetical protein